MDLENKIIYQMYQYLDFDGLGIVLVCVNVQIGVQRVVGVIVWLRVNNKKGILGEFVGGLNDVCKQVVRGLLDYLKVNSDVWQGVLWWVGGLWWGDYMFSFELFSGMGYVNYNNILREYIQVVGGGIWGYRCGGWEGVGWEVVYMLFFVSFE